MEQKKVSIVLPVYNGEVNLPAAVDSIINQTYQNIELIAVNDCSTDGTEKILNEYAKRDSRIVVLNNPVNLRLPGALNEGFAHTTGEYLTWTSDDNIYKENAIQKMVECLQADESIDMVYANFTQIDAKGKILAEVKPSDADKLPYGNVVGACFLYKREIAELIGTYDADLFLAEDYDYWIRMWKAGKLVHMDENLYYYRVHEGSLTSTKEELINGQTYKVLEKNFMFLYSTLNSSQKRNAFFNHIMYRAGENEDIEKRLYYINRKYLQYRKRCSMRDKILNLRLVRIIRKIKRRLFN